MLEHADAISIDAAPDHVHRATCALDWLGDDVEVTRIDGHDLAGRYQLRTHVLGGHQTIVLDVQGTGHAVEFASVGCKECTVDGRYVIESGVGGTRVTLEMRAQPHGRYRFMKPVLAPLMHKSMSDALSRLKAHVELRLADAA
jgi:hypothetical protein